MKAGIIGLGYWGDIIYRNLKNYDIEITTCDPFNQDADVKLHTDLHFCDKVFISTPCETHNELCRYFLELGKDVFCEKPFGASFLQAKDLYNLASKNHCNIFVDWIFSYSNQVNKLKTIINNLEYGRLKSVTMNRQNLGPVRNDISAKYDLASHDVSILLYLLNCMPNKVNWIGYKRNPQSIVNDSCFGLLQFENLIAQINTSWHYGKKDRLCIFEFEKDFLVWDDYNQIFQCGSVNLFESGPSSLENSINAFLQNESNMDLTLQTLKVLEYENSI
jgi:predicted dehydrogenase